MTLNVGVALQYYMEGQLAQRNYQILESLKDDQGYFKQVSAKKKDQDIYFVIERQEESFSDTYLCYVKIIGPSNIDTKFVLRDHDPNIFYSVKKAGIQDNYFIEGEQNGEVDEFLSNDRVFPLFANLMQTSIDHKIEVNSQNNRCLIRIKSDCNFTKALAALPFLESIIQLFMRENSLERLITGLSSYNCYSCGKEIGLEGKNCPHCGATAPICVICFRDPEPNEEIGLTNCCESTMHLKELEAWLEIKPSCPYCSAEDPTVRKIET